jgi:protein O-mannosyl-transferase
MKKFFQKVDFETPAGAAIILVLIAVMTVSYYRDALSGKFVNFDDNENVVENPYIRELSLHNLGEIFSKSFIGMYAPVTMVSYSIDYAIAGAKPMQFHLTNLLLHILNILLVFALFKRLCGSGKVSLMVAALFAFHPMNAEVVCWVSARSSLLFTMFYISASITYIGYISGTKRRMYYIASLALFCIAIVSKSMAATLPLVLFAFDYYYDRKLSWKLVAEKTPFFAVAAVFIIVTYFARNTVGHIQKFPMEFGTIDKLFLPLYSMFFFFEKLIIPTKLSAFHIYPHKSGAFLPWEYYFSAIALSAIAAGAYFNKNNRKVILFGLLFFVLSISIVIKFFPLGEHIVAERYAYLPYLGLFFILAHFLVSVSKHPKIYAVLFLLWFGELLRETDARIKVWQNTVALFNDVIAKDPDVPLAYNNRALERFTAGDYTGAMADFNTAIEKDPNFSKAYSNRGNAKVFSGDYPGAIADYGEALARNKTLWKTYYARGDAKQITGDFEGALRDYDSALPFVKSKNDAAQIFEKKATAHYFYGMKDSTLIDFVTAANLYEDKYRKAVVYKNLASVEADLGNLKKALVALDYAIELDPNLAKAYNGRASVKLALGDSVGAQTDIQIFESLSQKK